MSEKVVSRRGAEGAENGISREGAKKNELEENFIHTKYGYCYYEIEEGRIPIIYNLYIHPEYRRTGQAKKLLTYVIGQIRSLGYTGKIDIEALPREQSISREDLANFYEGMGLRVIENSPVNELAAENERLQFDNKELRTKWFSCLKKIKHFESENERLNSLVEYRIGINDGDIAFHPRAMKLIRKRKNFIVIAEDEPYFLIAYGMIRANEKENGRWTGEDEEAYQSFIPHQVGGQSW